MSNTVAKRSLFSKEEIGEVCDVPSSYKALQYSKKGRRVLILRR